MKEIIAKINSLGFDGEHGRVDLIAREDGDLIEVEAFGPKVWINSETIGDLIAAVPGFPSDQLEFVSSDDSASTAY